MEYIREIAIYILFTILFIILAIDITVIVRKLNTIDQKLDKIQQEQVMTNNIYTTEKVLQKQDQTPTHP